MPLKDKIARNEYSKKWVAKRRADFFMGKSCVICGSVDGLQLDHINRFEKTSHRIWSWAESKRLAEISKCQVLCTECHKVKTSSEVWKPITHNDSGYSRGCRCELCKKAHSERMKLRDRRKKK